MVSCSNILSNGPDNPWGFYLEGNGEYVNVGSDANASGYHLTSGGVTIGLDRRLSMVESNQYSRRIQRCHAVVLFYISTRFRLPRKSGNF